MANLDAPRGFRAMQNEAGTAPKLQAFTIATSTTVYEGTPVAINTTGQVVAFSVASTIISKRGIGVAAHYRSASDSSGTVAVYTDPHQLYAVQVDDNTLTVIGDVVFRNFAATLLASGNGTTLQSIAEIDGSTGTKVSVPGTTNRPFKAVRFSGNIQNDNSTSWNEIVVQFNSQYHMGAGGSADEGV